MLVDVVLMREGGRRLPREALLSAVATRGELRLAGTNPAADGDEPIAATLCGLEGTSPLQVLDRARVVRMRGHSMVIAAYFGRS